MLTVDFERLGIEPGQMTLDAGCGQGRHSLELVRRGCAGVAMDLNHEDLKYTSYVLAALIRDMEGASGGAARKGKRRRRTQGRDFLVMRGDALHLPFPAGNFDRIICSEVLEHVHDPGRALAELARVLKPGGLVALSVPTPFSEWAYWFASDDYFNTPGGHVRIFTPKGLARLVAAHGLDVVDLSFEHSFHTLYWWLRGVFGLHNEQHPVIHHFRKLLTYAMFSAFLTRAERLLNHVIPKSMVLYARKTGRQTA
jgi:SAM-dependent methyltransferase